MTRQELSDLAAELGLERAYEIDPEAFAAALDKARTLAVGIQGARSFADEPAHVFNVPFGSKEKPDDGGTGR